MMETNNFPLNVTILSDLVKGKSDKRRYQQLRLQNGIEAIVIHDPLTDTASASLDIAVGSFMDPPHRPGLAHFLEHLLFMGTEKFPDEAEYQTFLSEHGGYSNAYTDDEHTNYFFDVAWSSLEPALDRFSQFFIAPLFSASCTTRERDAVHSEHQKNISDDEWRREQLLRTLANPSHPFHSFGTGSSETLSGDSIRDEIISFYKANYCPTRMRLAILGRQPLEVLSGWVVEFFSSIGLHGEKIAPEASSPLTSEATTSAIEISTHTTSHQISSIKNTIWCTKRPAATSCANVHPSIQQTSSLLGGARLTKMLCVKPLRRLELYWATREVRSAWQYRPLDLLAEWIGDERPGSLLSHLKSVQLATSLKVGVQEFVDFSIFHVTLEITQQGLEQWQAIVKLFFHWLHFILGAPEQMTSKCTANDNCCVSESFQNFSPEESPSKNCEDQADHHDVLSFSTRWAELAAVRAQEFDFVDRIHPTSMVHELTAAMQRYPPAERLRGQAGWMWEMPTQELLRELVEQDLAPTHCHIMLLTGHENQQENEDESILDSGDDCFDGEAGDLDGKETKDAFEEFEAMFPERELWYGTRYTTRLLDDDEIASFGSIDDLMQVPTFCIPKRNPFISTASELKLVTDDNASPLPRIIAPGLWFKRDDRFGLPKGILFLFLRQSQRGQNNESGFAELLLHGSILQDLLAEEFYDASLAGLDFEFRRSGASVTSSKAISTGLVIQISGFSPHLLEMAERIAMRCCNNPIKSDSKVIDAKAAMFDMPSDIYKCRLTTQRERLKRQLQGEFKEVPYKQTSALLSLLLTPAHPGPDAVLRTINNMEHRPMYFDAFASLIHGNFTEAQALDLHRSLIRLIPSHSGNVDEPNGCSLLPKSPALHASIRQLPVERPVLLIRNGVPGPNSCVHVYFQVGAIRTESAALRDYAIALLLAQVMAEPFFDQLRTKEQLGYMVRAQPRLDGNVHGIELLVQSSLQGIGFLARRILEFVNVEFSAILKAMKSEDLERHCQALIHRLKEEPTTLLAEALPYWAAIWRGDQLFTLAEETSRHVSALASERNTVIKFFKEHLVDHASRRVVLVMVQSEEIADSESHFHEQELANSGLLQNHPIMLNIGAEETISMHESYCKALAGQDAYFMN